MPKYTKYLNTQNAEFPGGTVAARTENKRGHTFFLPFSCRISSAGVHTEVGVGRLI